MLTKKEFDILALLAQTEEALSQRKIADTLGCSLGTVNKILKDFSDRNLYSGKHLTEQGIQALEPYRVKRAIFIAAGFGARLAPITLNTPKPLVRVNGKRIIDTMLDAIAAAEIPEVIIVRGYLGEQFDQLLYKYPNIKFVENPFYNEYNNISSAMCVRFLLANAYIMDADLIVKNPGIIRKYEYQSNMLGIPVERTDDWCVTVDKNGNINSVGVGGLNAYREVCVFYWDAQDGTRLAEDLNSVYYSPGGKERYWEQVPLNYRKENYHVAVRACTGDDVQEVDTIAELKKIDHSYDL